MNAEADRNDKIESTKEVDHEVASSPPARHVESEHSAEPQDPRSSIITAQQNTEASASKWLGLLILFSLAWPVLYSPAIYLYASGWRPPWLLAHQLLLAIFSVHTVALLFGWGALGLRKVWERSAGQLRSGSAYTLETLRALTPGEFEQWTAALFERYDYTVVTAPATEDHGGDLLLTDPRGHPIVVHCKRYGGTVGEPVVRDLYGTVIQSGAHFGFLVTTGSISRAARAWARGKPLDLIDGQRLVKLAR